MHKHILIASRQTWPNILGLLLLKAQNKSPQHIHIFHTDSIPHSQGPAMRLKKLIAAHIFPAAKVQTHLLKDSTPSAVQSLLQDLKAPTGHHQASETEQWSINATGGLKTIFAGLIPLAFAENTYVFYREMDGAWLRLLPDSEAPSGSFLIKTQLIETPTTLHTNELPVLALMKSQYDSQDQSQWTGTPLPSMSHNHLYKLIQAGFKHQWDWRKLNAQFPDLIPEGTQTNSGFAFEAVFSFIMNQFDLSDHQAIMNAELQLESIKQEELDLVINANQRITVFDLKLTREATKSKSSAVVDQIAKVAEARRRLGGLNSQGVLIRPSWETSTETSSLAKQFGVSVWTQEDMPNLIRLLAKTLSISIPDELHLIHELLQSQHAQHQRIFSSNNHLPRVPNQLQSDVSSEKLPGWLDVSTYINTIRQKQSPTVIELSPNWSVLIIAPQYLPIPFDQLKLDQSCWGCTLIGKTKSKKGSSIALLLQMPQNEKTLHQAMLSPDTMKLSMISKSHQKKGMNSLASVFDQAIQGTHNKSTD